MFGISNRISTVLVEKICFSASPSKTMQNLLDISSKSQFGIRNVEIGGTHKENIPFFICIFMKNIIFGLQTTFFDGFNVLMSFLAEK